jgi:hypothetical protein
MLQVGSVKGELGIGTGAVGINPSGTNGVDEYPLSSMIRIFHNGGESSFIRPEKRGKEI